MNYLKILSAAFIACAVFYSCSVQKRQFRPGYYVNWNKPEPSKKATVLTHKKHVEKKQSHDTEPAGLENCAKNLVKPVTSIRGAKSNSILETGLPDNEYRQTPAKLKVKYDGECDVLVLKNGDELTVKVIEIGTEEIRYVKCDNQSGPVYVVKKSTAFMVKFANGSKEVFTAKEAPQHNNSQKNYQTGAQKSGTLKTDPLGVVAFFGVIVSLFIPFPLGLFLFVGFYAMAIASLIRIKNNPDKYKGKGWGITTLLLPLIILVLGIILLLLLL